MFGNEFYNETTRRYVATFGTLFNDLIIARKDNDGNTIQRMKVPIAYGPKQKFLARLEQDPSLSAPAMTLPRMSFELLTMSYAPERKLTRLLHDNTPKQLTGNTYKTQFAAVPYNLDFELNIMTKYNEDGIKILEQIIPFFTPDFTPKIKLMDEFDIALDVPIVLNAISNEDVYEDDFQTRRVLIWTLSFTVKGYYFGPSTEKKIIKFAQKNLYDEMNAEDPVATITNQPGLTANGEPTTDINSTIPYTDIESDDDWGLIVTIEEFE